MSGPGEHEIRSLVARVVDGLIGADTEPIPPPGTAGEAAAVPTSTDERPSVAIGADHGGYRLKEFLAFRLKERGHVVVDCGTHSEESVDYPDFAHEVATKVATGEATYGIVVDGAGIGSAIVANKVSGIRAALCYDISSARNSRQHNHANVLTLGAGLIGNGLAWQITEEWLDTPWEGGRHARRVEKIMEIDQRYRRER